MLNPTKKRKESYLEKTLKNQKGVFVAVSDFMRIVPDQIEKWVPGGMFVLGTDGFGRSDTRENLRKFFEINKEFIVIATLYQLALKGEIDYEIVENAIKSMGIDPEKSFPEFN
jgi:pyruvate dehydrogenase E1 component